MVVKVVVGANFGDEGKGLMTGYFCHQSLAKGEKCLVVLHNGGAQRGHTLVFQTGKGMYFIISVLERLREQILTCQRILF